MSDANSLFKQATAAFIQGQYGPALKLYQQVINQQPHNLEACLAMSSCLMGLGQLDEALVVAKQVNPHATSSLYVHALLQRSTLLFHQGRFEASIHQLEQSPNTLQEPACQALLANNLIALGRPTQAVSILDTLYKNKSGDIPLQRQVLQNLVIALCDCMRVDEALNRVLDAAAHNAIHADILSNALMVSHYSEKHLDYIDQMRSWVKNYFVGTSPTQHANTRGLKSVESLKIAFISGDFCQHPVGYLMRSFLGDLSNDCDITLYDNGSQHDSVYAEIMASVAHTRDVKRLSDAQLCDLIKHDQIDVLIDLSGHTRGNRLTALAHKPAPVQIGYLGYFGSSYLHSMDAVIFDQTHLLNGIPNYFLEKTYVLPHSRFCYRPPHYIPEVSTLPAIENGMITFGCFAHSAKFSDQSFDLWSEVLRVIPASRLVLKWRTLRDTTLKDTLWQKFLDRGIPRSRVILLVDSDHQSHFYDYRQIDIALDTTPFSSVTTTFEALCMGVPVITLTGRFPAANQSASVLETLNMGFCVAHTQDECIRATQALSDSLDRLSQLRAQLRTTFLNSTLANGTLFAQHFAKILHNIYRDFL